MNDSSRIKFRITPIAHFSIICKVFGRRVAMSAQEGLASLKIDRSRGHSRRFAWRAVWLVGAVAVVALVATAAPKWAESYFGVDVAVAKVSYLDAGKGELSAAGYVVADRMSVLAFKGTGRLEKLN